MAKKYGNFLLAFAAASELLIKKLAVNEFLRVSFAEKD